MINAIQTALSGLFASQKKLAASASNIANVTTAGALDNPDRAPYSAVTTVQEAVTGAGEGRGVKSTVIPKNTPFVPSYAPDSPFADENGLIGAPNVNLAEEAVNVSLAGHSFKASLKIIEAASEMSDELIRVLDDKA